MEAGPQKGPFFSNQVLEAASCGHAGVPVTLIEHDPVRGQCQAGSLTGAVHLSKGNAGVLRLAQRGQKPRVEQKGKCWLDPDFQYEYGPRKRGLSILLSV
jgi:hypothetical protein